MSTDLCNFLQLKHDVQKHVFWSTYLIDVKYALRDILHCAEAACDIKRILRMHHRWSVQP